VRVEECQRDWIEPGVIFEIIHAPPIEPLASWRQGWFILQDPSTLLPGCLVEPKEGENVLDYCAGDGLSTAWLAQLGGGKIQLHAENGFEDGQSAQPVMTRLGLKGVKLRRAPFAFPETGGHVLLYDKVLVQAPGSGSAALRMGVDRRWNLSPAEIEACAGRQFELLCAVASRVKNGGAIVYATASAEPEENQQVVARFLDAHPQFRLDRERQLLPGFQCVDGVYAARLVCSKPVNRKPVRRLIVTPDLPPVIAPLPVQAIPEPLPSCLALPVAAVTRQFHYEKVGEHFALALHEKPTPKPGPNEVLVRVRAVALGRRDWLALQESHPVPKDRTGLVAGAEGAGVIVAVGQGSSWQTGQRVVTCPYPFWSDGEPDHKQQREALSLTCDGVLSESVVLPDTGLAKLPDAMSFEEGACVPFGGLSAWNALVTRGQIQPGEKVLINGLGGIGVWALQITLAAGAKALTLSRNENKRLRALEMGASRTSAPDNPKLNSYVKSWTHNLGVQHVVLSGGPENVVVCISVLARGGQISCFGGFSGGLTPVNFGTIAARQARLNGVNSGSRAQLDACLQWLVERGVRPVVDRVFAFEEANEAMSHLADASPFGKVVIRVGQ